MKTPILSREAGAATDFKSTSLILESIIDSTYEVDGLKNFYSEITTAIASFGMCELHARQADRSTALNIDSDRADYELRMLNRFQAIGLNGLTEALALISDIAGTNYGDSLDIPASKQQAWANAQGDYKHFIADMEISGNDASLIMGKVQDAINAAADGGENGLVSYIKEQVTELITARNSNDRGTTPNIPWWKLVAIAIVCAVSVWLVIRCFKKKNCQDLWTIVNGAIQVGTKLVTLFC